jgi:hypothetical protein
MLKQSKFLVRVLPFLLSLNISAGAATVGFKSAVTYPVGINPVAVVTGDFNGDGKADLAVANNGNPATGDNGSVSILLGNGDGTFQPAKNVTAGKNPFVIQAADFNGDGRADLVLIDGTGVGVLLGNGDSTFGPVTYLPTASGPSSLAVADLDGDNKLDLVVAASSLSVLLGKGDGTFQTHVDYAVSGLGSVVVVDVNGDGRLDLATNVGQGIETFLGNGDGTFQPSVFCACGTGNRVSDFGSIAGGDINGDHHGDLAVLFYDGTDINNPFYQQVVLIGNGDGTFQPIRSASKYSGSRPTPVGITDIDGDGHADLVWSFSGSLVVSLGKGDGTFVENKFDLGLAGNSAIVAADIDGDKSPDIVSVNSDNTISVLLNSTGADFSVAASAPTPGTIKRGQSSTSTITLNHQNSFDDPVALTCSVQPAQSAPTCSVNPSSVSFDANGNASATLTMNAGAANASLGASYLRYDSRPLQLFLLPVAALFFLGVNRGCSHSRSKKLIFCSAIVVTFAGLIFQTACGGSGGGPHVTNYTITIAGTSGSTQHSTTVTLTVQ